MSPPTAHSRQELFRFEHPTDFVSTVRLESTSILVVIIPLQIHSMLIPSLFTP